MSENGRKDIIIDSQQWWRESKKGMQEGENKRGGEGRKMK
jgi:hypothetical protein